MSATILQINVSSGGVPKYAVAEASVNRLGIEGDAHAHPAIHGGPLQALLLIDAASIGRYQRGFVAHKIADDRINLRERNAHKQTRRISGI